MTTQTEAQRLADALTWRVHVFDGVPILDKAAAELRRLEADKDDWKDASFVFKDRALKAEEEAKRLANINSELCATHNKRLVREARSEERITELEAANAELVDVLHFYEEQSRLCRLIHSEGDPGRNSLAKDGGNKARAAIAKHGGAA